MKLVGLREAPEHLAVFTETAPTVPRQTMHQTLCWFTLRRAARAAHFGLDRVSMLDKQAVHALKDVPPTWRPTAYLRCGHSAVTEDAPLLHHVGWQAGTRTAEPEG